MAYYNLTTNASTGSIVIPRGVERVLVSATGTWGSGTLTMEFQDDQGTPAWKPLTSWTADSGGAEVFVGDDTITCRFTLAGATGPDIDITVK